MGNFATILGAIGGLFAVLGIIKAFEVIPNIVSQVTWEFWLTMSVISLLGSIAISVGRS